MNYSSGFFLGRPFPGWFLIYSYALLSKMASLQTGFFFMAERDAFTEPYSFLVVLAIQRRVKNSFSWIGSSLMVIIILVSAYFLQKVVNTIQGISGKVRKMVKNTTKGIIYVDR